MLHWLRHGHWPPVLPEVPLMARMPMSPQEALRHEFGQGWLAGAEDALRLLLDEPRPGRQHNGAPYTGHRPEELVVWARNALDKITEVSS